MRFNPCGHQASVAGCKECVKWDTLPKYREFWNKRGGNGVVKESRKPCLHLGPELAPIVCKTCSGSVKIKTFACGSPDVLASACTIAKPQPGLACCAKCPSYKAA